MLFTMVQPPPDKNILAPPTTPFPLCRRILGTEPEEDPNAPPGLGSGGHSRKSSLSTSGKPTKRKIKGFDGEIDYPNLKEKDEGPSATLVERM